MTDTPTYNFPDRGAGDWVAYDDYAALLARAEKAEVQRNKAIALLEETQDKRNDEMDLLVSARAERDTFRIRAEKAEAELANAVPEAHFAGYERASYKMAAMECELECKALRAGRDALHAERDALQAENDRLRDKCKKWVELAERTSRDHGLRLDANRLADFMQGIRETREEFGSRPLPSPTP